MAFNPLHGFRKHQKVFLAGLTIMCMFIFVLQFSAGGKGDFFSMVTDAIAGRSRHQGAGSLYGQTVTDHDIDQLQKQRRIANQYIVEVVQRGQDKEVERIDAEMKPMLEADKSSMPLGELASFLNQLKSVHNLDPKFARIRMYFWQQYMQNLPHMRVMLDNTIHALRMSGKKEQLELALALMRVVRKDADRRDPYFFGCGSYNRVKDLLDFKIWLHKADELGIQITRRDLLKLVLQETTGPIKESDLVAIEDGLYQQYKYLTKDMFLRAIGDEFRVRLAQAAVLGYEMFPEDERIPEFMRSEGRREKTLPPPATPLAVYDFFRDQRMESMLALLPIPAHHKDFLAQAGTPKEEGELQALFEKHKQREATEDSDKPGFMQPARVTLEWVSGRADLPFYQESARNRADTRQALLRLLPGTLPVDGGPAAAVSALLPTACDLPLLARYENILQSAFQTPTWMKTPSWIDSDNPNLHATSLNRPENAAVMLGQALGAGSTGVPLMAAPLAYQGAAFSREAKDRGALWSRLFLAGTNPLPFAAAGLAYAETPRHEFLPFAAVRDYVRHQELESLAKQLLRRHMSEMKQEMEALSSERGDTLHSKLNACRPAALADLLGHMGCPTLAAPLAYAAGVAAVEAKDQGRVAAEFFLAHAPLTDAAIAFQQQNLPQQMSRAYIAYALPKFGLQHGTSDRPRDRFDIADDANLQLLKEAHSRTAGKAKDFPKLFFPGLNAYTPQILPRQDHTGFPSPTSFEEQERRRLTDEHLWSVDKQPILFWKTGGEPAYVPTFAEARDKVKQRWQFEQARTYAKKEAERVAAEARKLKGDADRFFKDASPQADKVILLDRVARLSKPTPALMSRQAAAEPYQLYKIPADKVEFPTADFLEKLLALKTPGEVVVLNDRPESHYYVAALVGERYTPDFYQEYAEHPRALVEEYARENHVRRRFREDVLRQLQTEARLTINEEFVKDFEKDVEKRRADEE